MTAAYTWVMLTKEMCIQHRISLWLMTTPATDIKLGFVIFSS